VIGKAIYASVFGVNTVDEIKERLLQGVLKAADSEKWDAAVKAMKTVLKLHPRGEKVVAALPHVFSPFVMQNRLLVLDDIERKGLNLDANALLGFVDEMKTRYGCRILLVFNDAALGEAFDTWSQLREKVVDHEIVLAPSTLDSWTVANFAGRFSSAPVASGVLDAITQCGVVNIRIMNKIASAAIDILENHPNISDQAARRITSTITLLTAVYYKGIADAPSFRELRSDAEADKTWQQFLKESDARSQTDVGWRGIARRLGFYGGGAFENAVIDYLNTGWQKTEALSAAIEEIIRNANTSEAADALRKFLMDDYWDHSLTTEERVTKARRVAERVQLLDFGAMSQFLCQLDEIPLADEVAMSSFKAWKIAHRGEVIYASGEDPFGRPLHPWMVEYLKGAAPTPGPTSAISALRQILMNQFFDAEIDALETLSVDDYANLIEEGTPSELRILFPGMWKLKTITLASRNPPYSTAPATFIDACRTLCKKHPDTSLERLIRDQLQLQKIPVDTSEGNPPAFES